MCIRASMINIYSWVKWWKLIEVKWIKIIIQINTDHRSVYGHRIGLSEWKWCYSFIQEVFIKLNNNEH